MAKAKINPEFTYKTRDGQEVTSVKFVDVKEGDPYTVSAFINGCEEFFTDRGYYYYNYGGHSDDLIKQPVKKVKEVKKQEPNVPSVPAVKHKHHDLIVEWAKNPKIEMQFKRATSKNWLDFSYENNILDWDIELDYRLKPEEPKFLTITGSDGKSRSYPEPCKVKLKEDQEYFVPATSYCNDYHDQFTWRNDEYDERFMKSGIHLTKEAAELHAKAMLGID